MSMSLGQTLITIALIMLGTLLTRFLPFFLFPPERKTPAFVQYLGKVLPAAVLGMLVVYCYKDAPMQSSAQLVPALLAGGLVVLLQFWQKNLFLSLLAGTGLYMILLAFL